LFKSHVRFCNNIVITEIGNCARLLADRYRGAGNRPAPFRTPVSFAGKDGLFLLDQMRSLDKRQLVQRLGAVERRTLRATLARLRDVFAD
jgi:mRNA-degrading endonuclease toxin of MazEF toxin-antitoxin module